MSHFKLILVGDVLTLANDSDNGIFLVSHNSKNTATGVVANVTADAGITMTGGTASQGVWTPGTGVWSIGDLAEGVVASLDIEVTVTDTSTVPWDVTMVSVTYGAGDALPNNTAVREIDGATCEDINQCSNKTTLTSIGAGNYTVLTTDVTIIKTAHTALGDTLTLPSTSATGQIFAIHDLSSAGADPITLDTAGAELIDGQASIVMDVDLRYLEVLFDGTDYWTRNYKEWSWNAGRTSMALGSDFSGHSGTKDISIGDGNLEDTTITSNNISIGHGGMQGTGAVVQNSIGIGVNTLNVSEGSQNIAIGTDVLLVGVAAADNVGIGYSALKAAIASTNTIAIGTRALTASTASDNVAIGHNAMISSVTDVRNVALGNHALYTLNGGTGDNVGIGWNAGRLGTTGANNVYIGSSAGYSNLTGTGNVFLGYQAGYNELLSDKLYIANSNTATPLIHGDFSTSILTVNGEFGFTDGYVPPYTDVGAGDYTVLVTDYVINKTAITASGDDVTLPSTAKTGQVFIIKDSSGAAFTDNITVNTAGAELIDGISSRKINVNYNSMRVRFDGTNYGII